jgi:hypothetical protein
VKSTGMTGVKQFLKPDAYKQSEFQMTENRDRKTDMVSDFCYLFSGMTAYLLYNGSASWSY